MSAREVRHLHLGCPAGHLGSPRLPSISLTTLAYLPTRTHLCLLTSRVASTLSLARSVHGAIIGVGSIVGPFSKAGHGPGRVLDARRCQQSPLGRLSEMNRVLEGSSRRARKLQQQMQARSRMLGLACSNLSRGMYPYARPQAGG